MLPHFTHPDVSQFLNAAVERGEDYNLRLLCNILASQDKSGYHMTFDWEA